MGKAVKSVTNVAKNPLAIVANPMLAGNLAALGALGGKGKSDVFNGVSGAKQYTPSEQAFEFSPAQKAYQDMLRRQAEGTGPSQAQQQLKSATDRTMAQQIAQAASARGSGAALAQREAMRNQAGASQEAAGQSALLRAGEMQQAQEAYGQNLAQQQKLQVDKEAMKAGQFQSAYDRLSSERAQAAAGDKQLLGGILGAGATAFSDEKLKKNMKSTDLQELMDKIKATKFEYKQPNGESYQDGTVTGVMAQDLEKSKLGKMLVTDSEEGKMVDLKKAVPLALASVSELAKQIKELKKKV